MKGLFFQDESMARHFIDVTIGGQPVRVEVMVFNLKHATADFRYMNQMYSFELNAWKGRGFTPFSSKLVAAYGSGQGFGSIDAEGHVDASADEKEASVLQAVKDIFRYLNQIVLHQGRSVLDYAVWYRENHKERDTYEQTIQLVTCHCIVHSDFMQGDITWHVVPFTLDESRQLLEHGLLESRQSLLEGAEPLLSRARINDEEVD